MKTLRFFGMTLLMVLCAVNFTACSDDDEESLDLNSLEGTWMLVHSKGWEFCSNTAEKEEWDEDYDPNNLNGDSERIIITKIVDNKYSFSFGYYSGANWYDEPSSIGIVNGKTVELQDSPMCYSNIVIESLTSDKMVVRMVYNEVSTGEEGHYHSGDITNTYIKN